MTTFAKKLTSGGVVEWREADGRFTVFNVTAGHELLRLDRHDLRSELLRMSSSALTGDGLAFLQSEREREQAA